MVQSMKVLALVCSAATVAAASDSAACNAADGSTPSSHMNSFDRYTLSYFDGRGLAELPRTLFATVGRFPGAGFEDVRLSSEEFRALKGTGDLAQNLNRMPVLNHNGEVIGESKAIARYLAKKFGLFGTTDIEAAHIDAICEHLADVQVAYRKIIPYKNKLTDDEKFEKLKIWFDTPADAPEVEGRRNRQLQWFLSGIEQLLPGDGYAVGGRPSLADAMLYNMLGEHAPEVEPASAGEPFGDLSGVTRVLDNFPKLKEVVEVFGNSPGMKQYLETRVRSEW